MTLRIGFSSLFTAVLVLTLMATPSTAFADDATSTQSATTGSSTADTSDGELTLDDMLAADDESASDEALESRNNPNNPRTDHWTAIVARSALAGGIAGGLVGVGVTLVRDTDWDWMYIGQFAGVGILVGAAAGVIGAIAGAGGNSSDEEAADLKRPNPIEEQPASLEWMQRDLPTTYGIRGVNIEF